MDLWDWEGRALEQDYIWADDRRMTTFASALESADKLTLDEQEQLAATLQRRIAERRREELFQAVKEARAEHAAGKIKPASVSAIMKRIRA